MGSGVWGFWVGRPVARGVLRFLLPVRLVGYFGGLWTVDGKVVSGVKTSEGMTKIE